MLKRKQKLVSEEEDSEMLTSDNDSIGAHTRTSHKRNKAAHTYERLMRDSSNAGSEKGKIQIKSLDNKKMGAYTKGPWTPEEDKKLITLVNLYSGKNWSEIGRLLGTRIGKQCRERWHNHLNPTINKTPFSLEENIIIYKLHDIFGNKWSEISKYLPGRTDNAIKNQWNSSLQKESMRKRSMSAVSNEDILKIVKKLYYNQKSTQPTNQNTLKQTSSTEAKIPKQVQFDIKTPRTSSFASLNKLAHQATMQGMPIRKSVDGSNIYQFRNYNPTDNLPIFPNIKNHTFQFKKPKVKQNIKVPPKVFFNTNKNRIQSYTVSNSDVEMNSIANESSWSEEEENIKNILNEMYRSRNN